MKDRKVNLAELRQRAEQAIAEGRALLSLPHAQLPALEFQRLVEELRIYQAELEIQNEELQRAESATGLALERYSRLFEHLPLPAFVFDVAGVVQEANQQARRLLGIGRSVPPKRRTLSRLFDSASRNRLYPALADQSPGPVTLDWLSARLDGESHLPCDAHLFRLAARSPTEIQTLAVLVDRRAELAHRESEQRFRELFEFAPDAYLIMEVEDGTIVECNLSAAELLATEPAQLVGRRPEQLSPPLQPDGQTTAAASARCIEACRTGAGQPFEWVFRRLDGADIWVEVRVRMVPYAGRRVLLVGWRDITERKRLTEALTDSNRALTEANRRLRHFEAIVTAATDAIIGKTPEGVVTSWNPGAESLFGYSAAEMIGCPIRRLFPPERLREERELVARVARGEVVSDYETQRRRKDGQVIWVSITLSPMRGESGEVVGISKVAHDIGERKRFEQELREARAGAEAASAAKSVFLAHMSHEIRTPLNSVLGMVQVLERTGLDADQRHMARQIRSAGRGLLGILNDILDLSKIEAGRLDLDPCPFALAPLLEDLDSVLGSSARGKGLILSIAAPPALDGGLLGDPLRVEQVLVNLLGNAVKFTDQGEVRLRIEPLALTAETVRLRFVVSDTGIGIAPETLPGLFSPFTQGEAGIRRRFGGTGLGLAISKRLVEMMGGTIGVESRPGAGSSFWFELSFARTADPQPRLDPRAGTAAGPRLAGLHLLVVDDSAMNRELAERMLALEGARATMAGDGRAAVERLRAAPRAFDAVLMDIQMPVMDGLTAAGLIRSELGLTALPVIALTAGVLPEQQAAARAAGVNDVVPKPLDLDRLVAALLAWVSPRPGALPNALPGSGSSLAPPAGRFADDRADGPAFPEIEGVNVAMAAQRLGGDSALFRRLLWRFAEEGAGTGAAARRDLAEGHPESAMRRMHTLKGNAGTLGALEIMAAAERLELVIGQGGSDPGADLDTLDLRIGGLIASSASWREAAAAPPAADGSAPALDAGRLAALREALSGRDLSAMAAFAALRPALAGALGEARTQALDQAVGRLEFDAALRLLAEGGAFNASGTDDQNAT